MPQEFEIKLLEAYRDIPVVEFEYQERTLLTAEKDIEQAQALVNLPHALFAGLINYSNVSNASDYGPENQVEARRNGPFTEPKERLITLVPYHAASFATMIATMRADILLHQSVQSQFASDFNAALRIARRGIDHFQREHVLE
jgi:hypothetical protein